jgi:nucleoside-diphosphate-sugar epimerase
VQALRLQGVPRRLVYLSTTGVYGDCGGEWVDESRPVAPKVPRARRRWHAEQTLRSWSDASGCELIVLRVAGFYGPGRLPLERLKQHLPLVREEEAPFTNRIHVDDLATACLRAARLPMQSGIFNVSDGCHWSRTEFFARVAREAGLPVPPRLAAAEVKARLSELAWSFIAESRRIDNRRMRERLGVRLRYPDPADGIAASLAEMKAALATGQG